jgi:hypothetical protein
MRTKQFTFFEIAAVLCVALIGCGDSGGSNVPVVNIDASTVTGGTGVAPGTGGMGGTGAAGVNAPTATTGGTGMTGGTMAPPLFTPTMVPCGANTCVGVEIPGIPVPAICCADAATGECGLTDSFGCTGPPPDDSRCGDTGIQGIASCCADTGYCGLNFDSLLLGCVDVGSGLGLPNTVCDESLIADGGVDAGPRDAGDSETDSGTEDGDDAGN